MMPHGGGLGRKHQAVDPTVLHALELVAHGPLQLLIADLQPGPWGIGQVHDLTAAIGLQLGWSCSVVRMCIDDHGWIPPRWCAFDTLVDRRRAVYQRGVRLSLAQPLVGLSPRM